MTHNIVFKVNLPPLYPGTDVMVTRNSPSFAVWGSSISPPQTPLPVSPVATADIKDRLETAFTKYLHPAV